MRPYCLTLLFVLGACLGSFLCCQARRLRLREKSSKGKKLGRRSACLTCRHQIAWYDNLPIVSWLILRGRCRHCRAKIGWLEPLSEIGLALAFLCFGLNFALTSTNPLIWFTFLLNLLFLCFLAFLAIYDAAYGELPTFMLIFSILAAAVILILKQVQIYQISGWSPDLILSPIFSVAILAGTYLILYLVSRGKWVGDGDWLLGLALGLTLASPWLALLTLCLANLLACLASLPTLYRQKSHRHARPLHIPLGPFFVIAFVIVACGQDFLLKLI